MGIRKVVTPTGEARFEVRLHVRDRERRRRCRTLTEAKRVEADLKREATEVKAKARLDTHRRDLGLPQVREITLEALIAKTTNTPDFNLRSDASTDNDLCAWDLLTEHLGKTVPVHTITTDDLEQFRAHLLEPQPVGPEPEEGEEQKTKARKPSTVNRIMTPVRALLERAVRWGHILNNPAAVLSPLPTDPPAERVLTAEEEKTLLNGIHQEGDIVVQRKRNGPLPVTIQFVPPENRADMEEWIIVLLDTGARTFSEVGKIRWCDIDWKRGRIRIPTAKRDRRKQRMVEDHRIIGMTTRCREMLKRRRQRLLGAVGNVVAMQGDPIDDQPIFGADKIRYQRFRKLCKRVGLKGLKPYSLRHTAASRIVEATGKITIAQAQLGHTSPKMTMRYAHFAPEMGDQAATALEDWRKAAEAKSKEATGTKAG